MLANPPTSLTTRERRNPPPRQKSCAACIRAKRRCEAGAGGISPTCVRCEQRGLTCELPAGRRSRRAAPAVVPSPAPSLADTNTYPDFLSTGAADTPLTMESCAALDDGLFNFDASFLGWDTEHINPMTLESDQEPLTTSVSFPSLAEPTPLPLINRRDMPVASSNKVTWAPVPDSVRRRLQYPMDQIKKVPGMFVRNGQTPWCHPKLYDDEMPRCIQDVLGCCALSTQLNPINTPLILRTITIQVKELLSQPEPSEPLDILARTHAILLYHIILIFSCDISTRSIADCTKSALEDLAMSLIPHINFDIPSAHPSTTLPFYPLGPTTTFWKDWIFHESGRRTLLFTFFLLQAYRLLCGEPVEKCDGRLGMCHSFTLSAQLWHAPTAVEFAREWGGNRHHVVTNGKLEVAFLEARASNVDAFGRILITSILGVDEAEGWFASRGASLYTGEDGFM